MNIVSSLVDPMPKKKNSFLCPCLEKKKEKQQQLSLVGLIDKKCLLLLDDRMKRLSLALTRQFACAKLQESDHGDCTARRVFDGTLHSPECDLDMDHHQSKLSAQLLSDLNLIAKDEVGI